MLNKKQIDTIVDLARYRVETRKPLAYITNSALQQGEFFYVDERVIIPRSYIAELLFSKGIVEYLFSWMNILTSVMHLLYICSYALKFYTIIIVQVEKNKLNDK